MSTKLEETRSRLVEATARLVEETAKYEDAPPTDEQLAELNRMKDEKDQFRAELNRFQSAEKLRMDAAAQDVWLHEAANSPPHAKLEERMERDDRRSIGQRFVDDPEFKSWLQTMAPNGAIPDSTKGLHSPPLQFRGFRDLSPRAALLTGGSDTSGGALVIPDQYTPLTEFGRRPLSIRSVVTNGQTDSDAVEFVRVTGETNAAAPVAEATAASGSSGVKPESAFTLERVSAPVRTIAHWIPATKRAVSDASQLRTLIDSFLRFGLEEELEDQMVNGDGTGENFTGFGNVSGVQAQAWATNILTTTRQARRKVRTVGRRIPNAFILNPLDWEIIDLLQDNEARYYSGGPFDMMTPRLWGLPVVESEAVPSGVGYVGDFSVCVLWDREQATIQVSDSHSDFFVRNLVAILAEMRAAFGVLKPNALVEIDLTA